METDDSSKIKSSARLRADAVKDFRCKHLIAVLEDPHDIRNVGAVIRNVNAMGVEKAYVVDPRRALPDDWQEMRTRSSLLKTSVSAVKWSFVKRFDSTEACLEHVPHDRARSCGSKRARRVQSGAISHPMTDSGHRESALAHLKARNFTSIVTSPHMKGRRNVVLHEGDYTIYPKLAVWFGNEARGVSDAAVAASELCVAIPMVGMIESLNLGTTSSVVLYEVTRQRRDYQRRFKRRYRRGATSTTDR